MTKKSKIRWFGILTATALLGVAAGCQHDAGTTRLHGEKFRPDDEARAVQTINAAQAAAGAAADATLHPAHFSSSGLNSLGREKLDLMLKGEEPKQTLVVYLDLPMADTLEPAHQAVTEYLKSRGLPESQIKLVDGANPDTLHNSSDAIAGIQALRISGQTTSGGAAPSGSYATPPAAPTGDSTNH